MRVLWLAPRYCWLGGGEVALHFIAQEMCRRGAKVRVVSGFAEPRLPFPLPEGMDVLWLGKDDRQVLAVNAPFPDVNALAKDFDADVVLTYCEWLIPTLKTCERPVGVYCCSIGTYEEVAAAGVAERAAFWLMPSKGLAAQVLAKVPKLVVYPYTPRAETFAVRRSDAQHIGLVNRAKGQERVQALARANPTRKFLGLQGGWGAQGSNWPVNVECLPQTMRMGEFYERLRVLLVPSEETFSLSGVEAQAAGVPVVALDTPILRESLGDGAIFCPPTVEAFDAALKRLDDPVEYAKRSLLARTNAARYDLATEVERFMLFTRGILSGVSDRRKAPVRASAKVPVIVSMTTIPRRNGLVDPTIASLKAQTLPPDEIRIYMPPGCAPIRGATNIRRDHDAGPVMKISAVCDPEVPDNALIVTVDDDVVYKPDWLETLVNGAFQYPGEAVGMSAWNVSDFLARENGFYQFVQKPGLCDVLQGVAGVAYWKWYFDESILTPPKEFRFVDDVWISSELHRRGIPRRFLRDPMLVSTDTTPGLHDRPDFVELNRRASKLGFKDASGLAPNEEVVAPAPAKKKWVFPKMPT